MRVRALKTTAIAALLGAAAGALVALAGRWWVARDTTSDFGFYSYTPLRSGDHGLAVHTRLATSWWQLLWPAVGTGLVVAALAAAALTLRRHGLRPLPRGRRGLLSLGAVGLVLGGAVGGALYLRAGPADETIYHGRYVDYSVEPEGAYSSTLSVTFDARPTNVAAFFAVCAGVGLASGLVAGGVLMVPRRASGAA